MNRQWVKAGFVVVALVGGLATVALAEELVPPPAAEKGIRGLANTGLGVVVELPKGVYYGTIEDGPLYGLTVGVVEGLSWGIARTLVGVYEVLTFPFPIPEGYRPIYTPSYPYESGRTDVAD